MNAEQKKRMAHDLGQWNAAMKSSCSVSDLLAISTRMAALLQELIDAPEPEQPNQSEQHLEMVNPPAPSVPDSKTLQFLTDVLTAAGLLRHGKKDAGLATRIADESCRIRQQLFTQPEQPADVAQDAERYRAIRGGIVDIRDCGNTVAVEYKSVVRYCRSDEDFDQEIDAAIKRQGGES